MKNKKIKIAKSKISEKRNFKEKKSKQNWLLFFKWKINDKKMKRWKIEIRKNESKKMMIIKNKETDR